MSIFTKLAICCFSVVLNVGHTSSVTNQHWLPIPLVLSCCQRDDAVLGFHRCRRHGVFLEVALRQHEIQVSLWHICCSGFNSVNSSLSKVAEVTTAFMFPQWSTSQICWAVASRSTGLYFLIQQWYVCFPPGQLYSALNCCEQQTKSRQLTT